MKFLELSKLVELTTQLSDAPLGLSPRVLQGRVEAYSMKRAGSEKKFAHNLGKRYVAEVEALQQELAASLDFERKKKRQCRRRRSVSEGSHLDAPPIIKQEIGAGIVAPEMPKKTRERARSFDLSTFDSGTSKTTLGDFSELTTRRLMTDLILTLNSSFPDYDFSNVKPSQFEKCDLDTVRKGIFERLSELASYKNQDNWLLEVWQAVDNAIDMKVCDVYSFEEDLDDSSLWSFHYFFVNKSWKRIVFFTCIERISDGADENEDNDIETDRDYYVTPDPANQFSDAQLVDDFDWDPSDDVAGGIPISMAV